MRARAIGLLCALALALPARAELPPDVALALARAGIADGDVGIVVRALGAPRPLLSHGAERAFNPASLTKLLTTLAALDTLGPAHTFSTDVLVEGALVDGVLRGRLILRGGGDPALTLERFWLLLRELRARGIRDIEGDVLLDNGWYALAPIDPGAFDQRPLRPYNAPPAALLVNFNTVLLRLGAGPNGIEARLDPDPSPPLALVNRLQALAGPCGDAPLRIEPRLENGALVLDGAYAPACGERAIALNLLAPEATVASTFTTLWQELGGRHVGAVRPGRAQADARLLLEFRSPPLAVIVRDINKHSNNVMAKMLYLNLGALAEGAPATWDKGARALHAWLARVGLDMPELVLENGSGLSRVERLSAASLERLLQFAATRPAYHDFAASLPALGVEGTQRHRPDDTPGYARAWLKSGTLNSARNLAGYVLGEDGVRRTVVLLVNHERAHAAAPVQDALLRWTLHTARQATDSAIQQ
jgi:D-alanyl-D-alanine carboxypeptidase/D-alanyl-D-alanine-endopeptidase (penicillin-binding protein 4)